jgi:hypothetical protein
MPAECQRGAARSSTCQDERPPSTRGRSNRATVAARWRAAGRTTPRASERGPDKVPKPSERQHRQGLRPWAAGPEAWRLTPARAPGAADADQGRVAGQRSGGDGSGGGSLLQWRIGEDGVEGRNGGEQQAGEWRRWPDGEGQAAGGDRGWAGEGWGAREERGRQQHPRERIPPPPAAGGLCPATCAGGGEGMWWWGRRQRRPLGFPPESPHKGDDAGDGVES